VFAVTGIAEQLAELTDVLVDLASVQTHIAPDKAAS
jgi:hypothetical protein